MTDRYKNALDDALKQLMLCFNWHNGYCTEDQKRFHDIIQTEIKQLRNDIKLHIEMGELLATESEQLRKERDELLELAKYTEKACLCQRFKTKGFDYNEVHPEMGKCEGGSRWITPSKYAESLLAKKVRDENGNA